MLKHTRLFNGIGGLLKGYEIASIFLFCSGQWPRRLFLSLLNHDRVGVSLPLQGTRAHILGHDLIGDLGATLLESLDIGLKLGDTLLLDLARHHLSALVLSANALQFLIILEEESQVLERNVVLGVTTKLTLQLGGVLAAREGVLVDLVLDLVGSVAHKDGRAVNAGRHLRSRTLKSRKEDRVDERWLLELHFFGMFTALTEVGVLVNGTRNQTGN